MKQQKGDGYGMQVRIGSVHYNKVYEVAKKSRRTIKATIELAIEKLEDENGLSKAGPVG